jgi:hypothetical protein
MRKETLLQKGFRILATRMTDAGDLDILYIDPPSPKGRCWVSGSIQGHIFNALVFPEHASYPSYELERSRISKLDIRRQSDYELVVNFDRGWDIYPITHPTQIIVDILSCQLAKRVFPWFGLHAMVRSRKIFRKK